MLQFLHWSDQVVKPTNISIISQTSRMYNVKQALDLAQKKMSFQLCPESLVQFLLGNFLAVLQEKKIKPEMTGFWILRKFPTGSQNRTVRTTAWD